MQSNKVFIKFIHPSFFFFFLNSVKNSIQMYDCRSINVLYNQLKEEEEEEKDSLNLFLFGFDVDS